MSKHSRSNVGSGAASIQPVARPEQTAAPGEYALKGCLDRLEALLAQEEIALSNLSPEGIREINARKSTLLLELDRSMRAINSEAMSASTIGQLKSLRVSLEHNLARTALHLSAVNEIMSVVRQSVERSEADGTYTRTARQDEWLP